MRKTGFLLPGGDAVESGSALSGEPGRETTMNYEKKKVLVVGMA